MAQLKEILEKEKERISLEQCSVIHLFREGTFYRAYDWSAWLSVKYFKELKITHRLLKGGEDVAFVGFPVTSIERYTPEGASVKTLENNNVDIVLQTSVFPPEAEVQALQNDFGNWKRNQPLTEASKKKAEEEKSRAERNAHPRLTDIMLDILSYPIEQHSPMECMFFLSETKQQISEIL